MKMTPESCAAALVENFGKIAGHFKAAEKILEQFQEMVEKYDGAGLQGVTAKQRREMTRVKVVGRSTEHFAKFWHETRDKWPSALAAQADEAAARLRQASESYKMVEKELEVVVKAKMEQLKGEIGKTRVAARLNAAYKPAKPAPAPRRTNKKT